MNVVSIAVTQGFETLIHESRTDNPTAYGDGSNKKRLRTCVVLHYHTYELSLSNMLGQPTGELGVWHPEIDGMLFKTEATPQGIVEAMAFVDKHVVDWSDGDGGFLEDSVDAQILHDEGGDITDGATDDEK